MSERASSSIVLASGLPSSLTCTSIEQYEEQAISLSTNPDTLLELRSILEEQRETSPLFDTEV